MFTRLIFFTALIALPTVTVAENSSHSSVTLEEVLAYAIDQSPSVQEIESRIAQRRAEGIELSILKNPEVDSEIGFPVSYDEKRGSNEASVSLSQPLRLSNFGLRQRINKIISKSADSEKSLEILSLTQNIKLAYVKGWVLQERILQLDLSLKRAQSISNYVQDGITRGLFGVAESSLFKFENESLEAEKLGLGGDLERARAELLHRSGLSIKNKKLLPLQLREIAQGDLENEAKDLPVVKRVNLLAELANEQHRLSRLDSFPQFAPRLVYSRNDEGSDYVGVGISVELPFFDRNQAERLRRGAEVRAARSVEQYYSGPQFNEELFSLLKSTQLSQKEVRAYEEKVLPALREALQASDKQLKAGQGSLLQTWQLLQQLRETQARALELWSKAISERAELSILVGKDL